MTATHLILHQYDISPFSQKAQKMMGLKGLAWQSIEMPLIAPKPDVEALTGGIVERRYCNLAPISMLITG